MGLMTDREKNDVDGMLRTLNEKRVELFGESCEKKLMDILDKDEKYLRELCKIWVSFSTDRQPLAVFAEFLSAVVRKRKTLVDFCTKEICAPFTSDSFALAVSLISCSKIESNIKRLAESLPASSPLECYLRNYICNNPSSDTVVPDETIGKIELLTGSEAKTSPADYASFSQLVESLPTEPVWAPEWYLLLKACLKVNKRYWQSVESLFAPAFLLQAELREQEARTRRDSRRRTLLLGQLVRLLRARCESPVWHLLHADSLRAGYPPLDEGILRDPLRGHWDLWPAGAEAATQVMAVEGGLMARDPLGDVQDFPVCIDFGTCSTVVALRERGRKRLLRVGVRDWRQAPRARHFENPTALEFVDAAAFDAA